MSWQAILEPYTFTTANPGKEVRGKLIDAFNDWLQVPPEQLNTIAKIVNMLHSASLMYGGRVTLRHCQLISSSRVDDIEDDSKLRRGNPGA